MTRFNEIGPLHSSQRSSEVLCTELPNYIGSNLVWQERMRLPLTYGEILEVSEKGNHVIVTVSKSDHFNRRITEKLSLTRDTRVVIHHKD